MNQSNGIKNLDQPSLVLKTDGARSQGTQRLCSWTNQENGLISHLKPPKRMQPCLLLHFSKVKLSSDLHTKYYFGSALWKLKCTHRISRRKERGFLLDERIGLSAERIGENYTVSVLHRISKVKKNTRR